MTLSEARYICAHSDRYHYFDVHYAIRMLELAGERPVVRR